MKIREIMEKQVISVGENATYAQVAEIISRRQISGVPVLSENDTVVGMVSEKDLFRIAFPRYQSYYEHPESYADLEHREGKLTEIANKKVGEFMTKNVICLDPNDPAMKAGGLMLAKGVSRLPVVENGKVVGIVSRRMIYKSILKENFNF